MGRTRSRDFSRQQARQVLQSEAEHKELADLKCRTVAAFVTRTTGKLKQFLTRHGPLQAIGALQRPQSSASDAVLSLIALLSSTCTTSRRSDALKAS